MRGAARLRAGGRRLLTRVRRRALVLVYHRVADFRPDPQFLCVSPERFADQLEHLRRAFRPVPLAALAAAIADGTVPHRAIALTFDDGYVDNLVQGAPLLERYETPATVFVASGFVDGRRELPSDALERCLLAPVELPDELELEIGGERHAWRIDGAARHPDWNVTLGTTPTARHRCYLELHALLRPLGAQERQRALDALARWTGVPLEPRADRRVLDAIELRALDAGGLVAIGAHGVHHLVLAAQPADVQQEEVAGAKAALETILGVDVPDLAYPYGGAGDVGSLAPRFARESGFRSAWANVPAPLVAGADAYLLPRMLVRDWSGAELVERLEAAFAGG